MHDVFSDIRSILKVDGISIDNNIFRLHYKATVFVLIAASLLLTQTQYFGDPIDCIVEGVDQDVVDTYCWIHATYTHPSLTSGEVGVDVAHSGVGPSVSAEGQKHEVKQHKYYQWVTFFVVLQAIFFYVPRCLWKMAEGGKMKMLVTDLDSPIVDEEAKTQRKNLLVSFITLNFHRNNFYAVKYFVCEVLNFVNVVGQIYFTNRFLGYEFTTYGTDVVKFNQQELGSRHDPMDMIFPKVAKCDFHKFGSSGSKENHDALCVLPLNILSEKIFIFLWFWYILVAVLTGLALVYRIVILVAPPVRKIMLRVRSSLTPSSTVDALSAKCQIGDWFLLYQLAKNMDPIIYREFLEELNHKMKKPNAL
ncbi:hypothetical protein Pmani_023940 [Petrolisthes manimaculis]|uniref:Innexin n=1 Tax=Petrolisthes manimaculis TaxID=1843537 RepID=A0AAE1U2T8_9EUCA|nr:hypothetical protein Pmani_023940 [Petrolisthes manimaculis]